MFPLQLEELQTPADLDYMEKVFVLDQSDEEAAEVSVSTWVQIWLVVLNG